MATANEEYWNNFSVTDTDIERLYGFVLEHARPISSPDLVRQIVEQRVRDEEERRARYNAEITLYQPKLEYQIGQRLIFSKLGDTHGVVTAVRPGENPRLPPFQVVAVRLEGDGDTREFASLFDLPHPLNEDAATSTATSDLTADQVLGEYNATIESQVLGRLRRDREFVEQDGRWLLRGLLMPVSEYHLNLAEAAIEQAFEQDKRAPATSDLASVLEISGDGQKKGTLLFSIEYALRHDNRFADVGRLGEPHWSLTRLIPLEAQQVPQVLELAQVSLGGQLPPELEAVVAELEGQADVSASAAPHGGPTPLLSVALTYPHRRAGSLPLTAGLNALLPESDRRAMLVWLVDEATGSKMPGWVVREGNYLAGLKPWYDQRKLNPGAFIQLQRRPEPQTLSIEYQGQRERSLWVRVARVQGGQLTFTQERRPVGHKYDEEMLILVGDQNALDTYHNQNRGDRPIEALLIDIFPELAKLVPGGRVHAKTLFSAVNFARRIGPRPVFQALAQSSAFASLGGGYYALETARDFAR